MALKKVLKQFKDQNSLVLKKLKKKDRSNYDFPFQTKFYNDSITVLKRLFKFYIKKLFIITQLTLTWRIKINLCSIANRGFIIFLIQAH